MNFKFVNLAIVAMVSLTIATPSYARGGFGGFGGGRSFGGFGGGDRSFGSFGGGDRSFGSFGGDRNFGGGDRSWGSGDRNFGGGDRSWGDGDRNFGSGDRSFSNDFGRDSSGGFTGRPENNGVWNRPASGGSGIGQGFGNKGDMPISSRPNMPDHLPTDGGFGGISGLQNKYPHTISQNNLNDQGSKIRNNFNNNTINQNNFNNVNVNRGYGAYGYGHYGNYGYHPYANGYAHGWANSNMYHGYWGYPGAWYCPGWSEATAWTCMGITSLTAFLGLGMMGAELASSKNNNNTNYQTLPVTNVIYEGDNVYVNGTPAGNSAQYYQQAQQLAAQGFTQSAASLPPVAPDFTSDGSSTTTTTTTTTTTQGDKWAPLGVFSLAEPGQTQSNMLIQLAISPQGVVRGNYMNQLTNEKSQVYGQLDKKTQRISWTIGENNTTVFDTSLGALTKDDSQVLVHYGPNSTQEMALIRLPQPKDSGTATPPASS